MPARSLGAPATSLGEPATSLRASRITVEQSGKNNIFFGNAAGVPGNLSYYILFNNCCNSCIQVVVSSRYLYSYRSTHGISGLAAGGASELFKVCLKMRISELRATLLRHDQAALEMHLEVVVERIWRYTRRP